MTLCMLHTQSSDNHWVPKSYYFIFKHNCLVAWLLFLALPWKPIAQGQVASHQVRQCVSPPRPLPPNTQRCVVPPTARVQDAMASQLKVSRMQMT